MMLDKNLSEEMLKEAEREARKLTRRIMRDEYSELADVSEEDAVILRKRFLHEKMEATRQFLPE